MALAVCAAAAHADPDPGRVSVIESPVVVAESRFGAAVAAGDFDGDGSVDLAVSDPYENDLEVSRRGIVRTFHRTSSAWVDRHLADLNNLDARFGETLAFADFDADGRDDLLIGAPAGDGLVGSVYLVRHLAADTTVYGQLGGTYASDCGSSLAVGDFNDDGHMDFATGCPSQTVGVEAAAGEVRIGYGDGEGSFSWGVLNQDTASVSGGAEPDDRFGFRLASGDFNCDGIADLAVGVPYEAVGSTPDAGVVQVFAGSASGIPAGGNQLFDYGDLGGVPEGGARFGFALAAGGFDDTVFDDCDDLAIGMPYGLGSSKGVVLVMNGSAGGLTPLGSQSIDRLDFVGVANAPGVQQLGLSLLAADFGRGVQDDLVLGMPGEPGILGGEPQPGVACIAYGGSGEGVFGNGAQCISAADISPAVAADLDFGLVLAAVARPGDRAADLAFGLPGSRQALVLGNTLFRDGFEGNLD